METKRILICTVILFALPGLIFARSEETVSAVRVETPPVIDGVINPDEYPVEPASGFRQEHPNLNSPAINETEVYIVYDDEALYFGIICFEKNTAGLVANEVARDAFMQEDDCINVMIDANNDGDSAYDLMINCTGNTYDGHFSQDGNVGGREWDGVWTAKTSIGDDRWVCEIRFPWDNMVYDAGSSKMGLQFLRFQQSDYEITYWASDGAYLNRVATFGTLTGLEGLKPPKRFTVLPYGTVRGVQPPDDEPGDIDRMAFEPDGGIDFGFNGGKSFQLNATFNPDYAQIEADPEVINLTPGIIYLDEKRPFFTEANTAFDNFSCDILYTRAITEILAGGKVTGKAGPVNYAVMDIQLEKDDIQFPGDNVAAARVKANIYEASYVGTKFVARKGYDGVAGDRDLSNYNVVGLVDVIFALPYEIDFKAEFAKSRTDWFPAAEPAESGRDYAYSVRLSRREPGFETAVRYDEMGENFQSDISYYEPYHKNDRQVSAFVDKVFHIYKGPIRDFKVFGYYNHHWRIDNVDSIYNYAESYADLYFTNGLIVGPYVSLGYDDRFYSYGLPRYPIERYGIYVATEGVSWGSASAFFWRGEYYETKYNDLEVDLTFLPLTSLQIELDTEFIDPIYQPADPEYGTAQDRLSVVANLKVTHNVWDKLYWRAIIQGDNEDDLYLGSFLVGWEYQPGSNAYLAYEEERLKSGRGFELADRRVFLKGSYMFSF
ncbi:MAG: carbohydrate binding family 9 domain-containing protein [Candidatus Coatesbacteria bacterium]|nr:MAG: carbohydrate binding family 9 domain-containing protein [Candidatus Coatesbacteria bacterium]